MGVLYNNFYFPNKERLNSNNNLENFDIVIVQYSKELNHIITLSLLMILNLMNGLKN